MTRSILQQCADDLRLVELALQEELVKWEQLSEQVDELTRKLYAAEATLREKTHYIDNLKGKRGRLILRTMEVVTNAG